VSTQRVWNSERVKVGDTLQSILQCLFSSQSVHKPVLKTPQNQYCGCNLIATKCPW